MILKAYPPRMTPEQFEEWSDSRGFELIDGIVKEKNMGTENAAIQTRISYYLNLIVIPGKLGEVIDSEAMYHCFPSRPKQVRKPDVSFILRERLPDGLVPRGMCKVRPDLAVEVVSPNDSYEEVEEKLADYFDAGIPLIWIVTPRTRTVLVYRADGTALRLRDTDDLTADPIIPNFRVRIAELFPNPPGAFDPKPTKELPKPENS
jgi:Uma2 family endonuclease